MTRETTAPPDAMKLGIRVPADVSGWIASEKMDGIYARWNGSHFITTGGQVLDAPKRLSRGLGSATVEGELWAGRGEYTLVAAAYLMPASSARWDPVDFYPFDVVAEGDYRTRTSCLKRRLVKTWVLKDATDLARRLEEIRLGGGEGLVIRDPAAPYEHGRRSRWAVKVKCPTRVRSTVKVVQQNGYVKLHSGVTFKCSNCSEGDVINYEITGWGPHGERGARRLR